MTRRLWFQAAAILTFGLAASQSLAQQPAVTATYLGTQESIQADQAKPRLYQVTPAVPVISFNAAAVGVSAGSAQQITAVFNVNGNPGTFTPTATLHYGTSYSAGAVSCTGPVASMTCNVTVTFQPALPGGRRDAIFFMNGTTRLATVLLYGVGNAPLALVQPGVVTQPIKGSTAVFSSVVDENGTAYVLETQVNAVVSVTKTGVVTTLPITGLNSPRTIGVDGAGVLYIAGETAGGPITTYDTVQGTQGTFAVAVPADIFPDIAVGNTGNVYAIDGNANVLYTTALGGTVTHQAFSPAIPGPASMNVDSSENLFVGGQTTYELLAGATPQTQTLVSANNSQNGLSLDAAGTLYVTPFSGGLGMTELPAPYSTVLTVLDPTATPIGGSEGPDGTVYVGTAASVDKVDRSQGVIAFGNVGGSVTQDVGIYNGGNQSLTVSNIGVTGAGFVLGSAATNNCTGGIVLAAGAFCQVAITLSSTHAGAYTGTLTFTDNSLNNTSSAQSVALSGGLQGIYVVPSPASLNFGNQVIGTTSASQPVTFTNNGVTYSAGISLPQNTGPFVVSLGTCATLSPLAPGASCTMNVSFAPTTATAYVNTSIGFGATWSGPTQTVIFTVSGTGTVYTPYAPPSSGSTSALIFTPATTNLVAGLNGAGSTGNGGLATAAKLNYPVGLAYDSSGNLFFADENNFVVRRIDHVTGDVSIFAGTNGTSGNSLGGGIATNAQLGGVSGLVIDTSNNVYVADRSNNVVWKITSGGTISVYAGGGSGGLGDGGLATSGTLSNPWALGIDASNNIYIADSYNDLIRVVNQSTNIITTFAGVVADASIGFGDCSPQGLYSTSTPPYTAIQAHLCFPEGIAFDSSGNAYIVDTKNNIVRMVSKATGFITTYAGGGTNGPMVNGVPATTALFDLPAGVYVDPANRVYIGDFFHGVIRVVDSSGNINTVFGTGAGDMIGSIGLPDTESVNLNIGPEDGPYDFVLDLYGNLVVTDSSGSAITSAGSTGQYVFPQTPIFTTETSTQANATSAFYPPYLTISNPSGVTLSFTAAPTVTGPFAIVTGTGAGTCVFPGSVAPGKSCTMVLSFTPTLGGSPGTLQTGSIVLASNANSSPSTITLSGTGYGVATVSATLTPSPLIFTSPAGVTSAAQMATLTNTGQIPIAIGSTDFDFASASNFALSATTCPSGSATLAVGASCTYSITFTPTAATTYLAGFQACITTSSYGCLQSISLNGTGTAAVSLVPQLQFTPAELSAIAGTGTGKVLDTGDGGPALQATFNTPYGIAQDASGNVYVSDQDDNYVRKIDTSGNITAFAGIPNSGPGSFSGDNGQATAANLSQPIGIAIDSAGNVYIADYGNSRIRKVVPSTGIITTYAGDGNGFFNGGTAGSTPLPGPQGIAFDPAGNLYVACTNQQIVAKITPGGSQTLFAGVLTNPGPGVNSYNGDNQLAYLADLNFPTDVATDRAGNVYIADSFNYRIRKVTASTGIITTVAGTGTQGTSGDGGAATSAQISANSVATSLAGDIYINTGSSIRKVDVNGNITTIAGGGTGTVPGPATSVLLNGLGLARADRYGDLLIPSYQHFDGVLEAGPQGALVFPSQAVGTVSAPQTVLFENTGDTSLTLSQLTYTASGSFNVTGGTCISTSTLSPGGTCTLTVTFAPTVAGGAGPYTGSIPVNSNAAGGATSILLQGTATAAVAAPAVTITPNPDAFLPSPVGQQENAPTPMSLTNTGTGPLTISGITITGANASSFSQTNLCPVSPATLAAGAACGITVLFTPTTSGPLTANISVAGNQSGSPTLATLTGTGTVPLVTLNPNPLAFGNQQVNTASTAQSVTVTNTGLAPLLITSAILGGANASDFGESATCPNNVAAGANCVFTFIFTPGGTGARTATLVLTDNASGSPQTITLTGTGTAAAAPQAALNPNPLNFPSTTVGASSQTMTMSLGNSGNAALAISSISITGANASSFSQTNNCGASLPLDSACLITITFTPTTTGALTANISVADNATGSPQTAVLTGTGTGPAAPQLVFSPNPLAFPSTTVGTPVTLPLTLTNPGNAVLNVNTYTVTGANASNFTFTNGCSASLGIGLNCTLMVTFTPTSAANFTAAISVSDNATGSPHTATLTGTGTAPLVPVATLSPNPLAFVSTTVGSTATALPVTLSNTGGATLTGIAISLAGANPSDFAISPAPATTCGTTLAAGSTCVVYVSFTPASAASFAATLSVADNASGSPQTTAITGTGTAVVTSGTFIVNSSTPTSSVFPGAVAMYNITVAPLGGSYNNLVTLSASGLPAGASASFLPAAVTPGSAGAPSVLSIQTASQLARLANPDPHRPGPVPLLAVMAGVPLLGMAARRRLRKASRRWMLLAIAALSILPILAISGCSGGYFGPVPQTFTVTVTGTSGSLQETTTVSLTVQ